MTAARAIGRGSVLDFVDREQSEQEGTVAALRSMGAAEVRQKAPGVFVSAVEQDNVWLAESAAHALRAAWASSAEAPTIPFGLRPSLAHPDAPYALLGHASQALARGHARAAQVLLAVVGVQLSRSKAVLLAKRRPQPRRDGATNFAARIEQEYERELAAAIVDLTIVALESGGHLDSVPTVGDLGTSEGQPARGGSGTPLGPGAAGRTRRGSLSLREKVSGASVAGAEEVAEKRTAQEPVLVARAPVRFHTQRHPLEGATVFYAERGPNRYGRIRSPLWLSAGTIGEATQSWLRTARGPWVLVEDTQARDEKTGRREIRYLAFGVDREMRAGVAADADAVAGLGDVEYESGAPDVLLETSGVGGNRFKFLLFFSSTGQARGNIGQEKRIGTALVSEGSSKSPDSEVGEIAQSLTTAVDEVLGEGNTGEAAEALAAMDAKSFASVDVDTRIGYLVVFLDPEVFDAHADAKASVVAEVFGSLSDGQLRRALKALHDKGLLEPLKSVGTLTRIALQVGRSRVSEGQSLDSEEVRAVIEEVARGASPSGTADLVTRALGPVAQAARAVASPETRRAAVKLGRDLTNDVAQAPSFGEFVSGEVAEEVLEGLKGAGVLAQKLFYVRFMLDARALGLEGAHRRGQEVLDAIAAETTVGIVGLGALARSVPPGVEFIEGVLARVKGELVVQAVLAVVGVGEVKALLEALKKGRVLAFLRGGRKGKGGFGASAEGPKRGRAGLGDAGNPAGRELDGQVRRAEEAPQRGAGGSEPAVGEGAERRTAEGEQRRERELRRGERRAAGGGARFTVDPATRAADEAAGVLVNGRYIKNPTAQNLADLVTDTGKIGSSRMSGQFMYVVDDAGNIVIGTRAGQRMPHPTLIGGANPSVQGAGIVDIRGGRIFSVDNASGHFKPGAGSLQAAEAAFGNLPAGAFHRNFQGYLPFQ